MYRIEMLEARAEPHVWQEIDYIWDSDAGYAVRVGPPARRHDDAEEATAAAKAIALDCKARVRVLQEPDGPVIFDSGEPR